MDPPISALVTTRRDASADGPLLRDPRPRCVRGHGAGHDRRRGRGRLGIMRGSETKWTSSTRPCTCCASARLPCGLAGLHRPGESDPNRQGCLRQPPITRTVTKMRNSAHERTTEAADLVEEIKRRREAIENARTANRLEGLAASSGVRAIHDLWATGQITDEERRTRVRAFIAAEAADSTR